MRSSHYLMASLCCLVPLGTGCVDSPNLEVVTLDGAAGDDAGGAAGEATGGASAGTGGVTGGSGGSVSGGSGGDTGGAGGEATSGAGGEATSGAGGEGTAGGGAAGSGATGGTAAGGGTAGSGTAGSAGIGGVAGTAGAAGSGGPTVPDAPTDLVLGIASATSIQVSWTDASDDEDGFFVYWSDTGTKPGAPLGTTAADAESLLVTGLTEGTLYTFWVESRNAVGRSTAITGTATPLAVPPQPADLTATNGGTTLTLTWTDVADETGYNVYWSTDGVKPATPNQTLPADSDQLQLTDADITVLTGYTFWVEPVNVAGAGIAGTTTGVLGDPPLAPTSLLLGVTGVDVQLDWTDNSTTEDGFDVYWATANTKPGAPAANVSADVTTYTAQNLDPGTTYYFWVEASNLAGASSDITGNATTGTVPAAATGFGASIDSDTQLTINWTDNAGNEDGYYVYWSTTGVQPGAPNQTLPADASTTSVTVTGYTQYTFWIEPYNAVGSPTPLSGTATAGTVPADPSGVVVDAVSNPYQVIVTWNDNASNENGYQVYCATDGVQPATPDAVVAADSQSHTLTSVWADSQYTCWVEAVNLIGPSNAATATAATNTATLDWTELWMDDGSDVLHVVISGQPVVLPEAVRWGYHSANPDNRGTARDIDPYALWSVVTDGINMNATHYFWGEARATDGSLFTSTTLEPAPSVVGLQVDSTGDNSASLSWNAATGAVEYEVWSSTTDNIATASFATISAATSTTVVGLSPGTDYYFWIRSRGAGIGGNGLGFRGPAGNSAAATTTGTPIGPNLALGRPATASTGTAANATDGDFGSRWEADPTDYEWIYVELAGDTTVTHVQLVWETAYSSTFEIQTCPASCDVGGDPDAWAWSTAYGPTTRALSGFPNYELLAMSSQPTDTRFVRMLGTARATGWGHSLWELQVYSAP